jgi:hypothetical protein
VETGAKSWPAMLLQHGGQSAEDQMPVGVWTKMEKDSNGLRLQGKLANCVYRKLKPGRNNGEARRGSGVNE